MWVRGHIADFSRQDHIHSPEYSTYLIERVQVVEGRSTLLARFAKVDFRNIYSWQLYTNDTRQIDGKESGCIIREPTDEEIAIMTMQMLLGGEIR